MHTMKKCCIGKHTPRIWQIAEYLCVIRCFNQFPVGWCSRSIFFQAAIVYQIPLNRKTTSMLPCYAMLCHAVPRYAMLCECDNPSHFTATQKKNEKIHRWWGAKKPTRINVGSHHVVVLLLTCLDQCSSRETEDSSTGFPFKDSTGL